MKMEKIYVKENDNATQSQLKITRYRYVKLTTSSICQKILASTQSSATFILIADQKKIHNSFSRIYLSNF